MRVRFEATTDPPGVAVVDPIEQRRLQFEAPVALPPTDAATDDFRFPVDAACHVETTRLRLDRREEVYVRDTHGNLLKHVRSHDSIDLDPGAYSIEISGPIKVYLRVNDAISVSAGADYLSLEFEGPTDVVIGARSYHERPAATITTSEDPEDAMRAISLLASALKTRRCERAYPTLRGHPPLIEAGERFDAPEGLSRPETGVRIVVPAEHRAVYPVATLAFYLGAEVVEGYPPRIETSGGFTYELTGSDWFEDIVARVLKQVFFLDCVVRTEGLYRTDLYERRQVERHLPFDPAELYDSPVSRQVERYLEVPYETVDDYLPRWPMTAYVPPRPAGVEALPFVANELGVVRLSRARPAAGVDHDAVEIGGESIPDGMLSEGEFVVPDRRDDSVEHAWFAPDFPVGATKSSITAYHNGLDRSTHDGPRTTVVCNDETLAEEGSVLDTIYGARKNADGVTTHTGLTTAELADVLEDGSSFLHFIGEATADGLRCADGLLDVGSLSTVGADVFLLNAPNSAAQALKLIESGAVGGVATLGALDADAAAQAGRGLGRLLNLGFPLRGAVELIHRHAPGGSQYLVVGDGSVDVAQPGAAIPFVCDIRRRDDGTFDVSADLYPNREHGLGTTVSPNIRDEDAEFLSPGRTKKTFSLTEDDLKEFLWSHSMPVRIDGDLRWNDSLGGVDLE